MIVGCIVNKLVIHFIQDLLYFSENLINILTIYDKKHVLIIVV